MTAPDAALVDQISKVDFGALSYTDPADLQRIVDQANAYLIMMTGRSWATMPAYLEPLATQLVVLRTEQIAYRSQEDYAETANDDVVGSFSAGPYSETRHDPNRRGESKSINSNPAIAELLWMLLTTTVAFPDPAVDEMYDRWQMLLGGVHAPDFSVSEVDWSGSLSFPDWYSPWQRTL